MKIIKIVATRCHISKLKCTKLNFGAYSAPPYLLLDLRGLTSKRGEERKNGREDEGGKGGNRGKGGNKEGRECMRMRKTFTKSTQICLIA